MSKETLLIVLGVVVALAPFSGLPLSWLDVAIPLIGIAVSALGYSFRPKKHVSVETIPAA